MVHDSFAAALNTEAAAHLYDLRKSQNLRYKVLAEETGLSERSVYRYLHNEVAIPLPAFAALCRALGQDAQTVIRIATAKARGRS